MKTIALRDCCRFLSGGTPSKSKSEYWQGNVPWFSPKDMKVFDLLGSRDHISHEALSSGATQTVPARTILVVCRSGVLAHTLPVGILRRSAAFNQDIKAIVPDVSMDADYVALFLKGRQAQALVEGVKVGATVHSLKAGFLEALRVPALSLASQRRIAARLKAHLAAAEQARVATKAQLAEVAALRRAIYRDAFGARTHFPEVPLAEVAPVQSGYAFKSRDFKRSGIRLLRNANILPGRVYWDSAVFLDAADAVGLDRFVLCEGDVLLSLDRPLIADGLKVARVSSGDLPALLVQRVARFEIDRERLDPDYLYAYLNSTRFIEAIKGHDQSLGVPHISPKQVGAIGIPLPTLDQQRNMVQSLNQQLSAACKLKDAVELQAADLDALPARLLAQAFDTDHIGDATDMVVGDKTVETLP